MVCPSQNLIIAHVSCRVALPCLEDHNSSCIRNSLPTIYLKFGLINVSVFFLCFRHCYSSLLEIRDPGNTFFLHYFGLQNICCSAALQRQELIYAFLFDHQHPLKGLQNVEAKRINRSHLSFLLSYSQNSWGVSRARNLFR